MFNPTISQSMREAIRRAGSPMPQPTSSTRIPGRLADQVGVGIQRLREALPAAGKEPDMKLSPKNNRPSSVIRSK
jgi:hypothetical protein